MTQVKTTVPVFVYDSYANPAYVTHFDGYSYSITQLTGSDYGRKSSVPAKRTRPVTDTEAIEWASSKCRELKAAGRLGTRGAR